ncbi:hypothetical protein D9615_005861 [Tricholomella constricta]|uniref:F-box domain-containing protein n=1 Tax=Tricholomella constricta TaxID=117010 RepID=A0A8H5H9I4_9AGAR|nr:hypothetical protein D9615_005861 [Tricholomella constricta]
MHPALQLPELLYIIFRNLLGDWSDCRTDLLSCCLTCKVFSEVALDLIWEDLPSVSLMPFASPVEYNTDLRPQEHQDAYSHHLERLKFYGRRVRVLRVHSKLTPELLKCIARLGTYPPSNASLPSSFMSSIFPGLTTLSLVLSVNPLHEGIEPRIWLFLLPTVRYLFLRCAAGAHYEHLTDALRSINASRPSLTSLILDAEIIAHFDDSPPAPLDSELSALIRSLPRLEKLHLPLYLLTRPTLTAIAGLPVLKDLTLLHPHYVQWKRSVPWSNAFASMQETPHEDDFARLHSLTINSTFDFIPRALYVHPSLTSHISRLSLSCLPPPSRHSLKPLFLPTLSSPALDSLTHLSLNFTVPIYMPQREGLGADFFATLFAAPFISRLVSFHVQHRAPLDLDDQDFDNMARLMSSIESLRLTAIPYDTPRMVPRPSAVRIRASLGALASFARHCPRLREITLPVDAENLPIPKVVGPLAVPLDPRPVDIDMSVSPVDISCPLSSAVSRAGNSALGIARFLAVLFPHQGSGLTSQWAGRAKGACPKVEEEEEWGGTMGVEGGGDKRTLYARRWKVIGELAQEERRRRRYACYP